MSEQMSECGQAGTLERHDDAADEEHWFHRECFLNFAWWLSGHNGKRPSGLEVFDWETPDTATGAP